MILYYNQCEVIYLKKEFFPDGTLIDPWFYDTTLPAPGKKYVLKAEPDELCTEKIQSLIDTAHSCGGGTVVIPEGTYYSGALFFKDGVNLFIEKGGVLKGSFNISDYPLVKTRIEGETCTYFSALINASHVHGFVISGEGIIDGNGENSWRAFWLRKKWNPDCTNKDEQRPRLIYIDHSEDITVSGITMQNSHFWTNHLYKCRRVKYLDCKILSPASPVPAPSTDAIDLDVCSDVLIKNCYMAVNDDSVVLKGGKGPYADTDPDNGINERIIVEDCEYGFCHGCLTCGSESVHSKNIIVRRLKVSSAVNLLWLKMRPDTPQKFEYISVSGVSGKVADFININPWRQFFDLKGRSDIPLSYGEHITMEDCDVECNKFFDVAPDDEQYILSDFTFKNLNIAARDTSFDLSAVKGFTKENINLREI